MKDTVVSGSLRATDTLYSTTAQFNILRAPTTSGGTTFGPGSANNLLKSNGTSIYWTTLAASDIPNLSTDKLNSGTLGVARGGTGVTSIANIQAGKDGDGNTISSTYLKVSGGTISGNLTTQKFIHPTITGTGTAAVAYNASTSTNGKPALWKFDLSTATPAEGDIITITVPVAGHTNGVFVSTDNGTTYKPVSINGTNRLTTHYGVGTTITLVYDENGSTNAVYPVAGATATTNVTGGCWRVLNYYDSNTTYSVMSKAEAWTGTATSSRVMRADYLKQILANLGGTGLSLTHNATDGIVLNLETVSIENGGTGATSASGARTNLGLGTMATETAANYLKLSGGTMTGEITSTANIGLTIRPASDRAYLRLFPAADTHSDIAFGRGTTDTWSLSARSSSDGFFGLFNKINPSWAFIVSESSNNVAFSGQISTKYITVNAWDTNIEGGEIKLAGAPGYQSGKYYACLDVNSQDFRIHSNNQVPFRINLENLTTTIHKLTLTNVLAVQYGGTGASTAVNARNNLKAAAHLDLANISQPTIAKILTAINASVVSNEPTLVDMSSEVVALLTNNSTIGSLTGILYVTLGNNNSHWLSFIGIQHSSVYNLYTFFIIFSNGSVTGRQLYKVPLTSI